MDASARPEDKPVVVEGDVRGPVKIFAPQPHYLESARRKRIQGVVIVQSIIDKEGCVVHTKVLKGLGGGLSEVAKQTIQEWVFRPALLDNKPVDVYYNLTVNFRLKK